MKKKVPRCLAIGLTFLLMLFAHFSNAQSVVWEEDFEEVGPTTQFTSSVSSINGLDGWSYTEADPPGRLRFDVVAHNGSKAALFDSEQWTWSTNYLVYEGDLTDYSNITLTFWHNDYYDYGENEDKLWIRGSSSDQWIEVMNLDRRTNNSWKKETVDISGVLSQNGQSPSATFQMQFGQRGYQMYSSDGRAFDDLKITAYKDVALRFVDLQNKTVCGNQNHEINLKVTNNSGEDDLDIPVELTITNPDESTTSLNKTAQALESGEDDTLSFEFNSTAGGTYNVKALSNTAYEDPEIETGVITQVPYELTYRDYLNDNKYDIDYWEYTGGFNYNGDEITGFVNDSAQIVSPKIHINASDHEMRYYNNLGNMDANDTVFVQISKDCGATYNTVDTAYVGKSFDYRYQGRLMNDYQGEVIRVRYLVRTDDNVHFELRDLRIEGANVQLSQIFRDQLTCADADEEIGVVIENQGQIDSLYDIPVKLDVYGAVENNYSKTFTDTLRQYEEDTLYFNIDASQIGSYEVIANVDYPADTYSEDDERSINFEIKDPEFQYLTEGNYSGDPYGYWWLDGVGSDVRWDGGDDYFYSNWIEQGDTAFAYSPQIGPVDGQSKLTFKYRFDTPNNDTLAASENFKVQVSSDCGSSYQTVFEADTSQNQSYGEWKNSPQIDLSNYDGQNIYIRFIGTKTADSVNNYFSFDMDEVSVSVPDMQLNEIMTNIDPACGTADTAKATIRVENVSEVDAADIPVTLEVSAADFEDFRVTETISSIEANSAVEYTFNKEFNALKAQTYNLTASVNYENDMNAGNDTLNKDVTVMTPESVPYLADFAEWTLYRNNYRASGNTQVYTDYLSQGDSAYAKSMNVGVVDDETYMVFNFAPEAYDNGNSRLGFYLRENDYVAIQAQAACSGEWKEVARISDFTPGKNIWKKYYYDLSQFAGSNVQMRLLTKKNNSAGKMATNFANLRVMNTDTATVGDIFTDSLNTLCGDDAAPVQVEVTNIGRSVTDLPVTVEVSSVSMETKTFTKKVDLGVGETDTVTIETANTSLPADYTFTAYTIDSNQVTETVKVNDLKQLPYTLNYIDHEIYSGTDTVRAENRVGIIPENAWVEFTYLIETYDKQGDVVGNYLRSGDAVEILVSNDCGTNYQTIHTLTSSNHEATKDSTTIRIPLSDFEGDELVGGVKLTKGEIGGYRLAGTYRFVVPDPDFTISGISTQEKLENYHRPICGEEKDSVFFDLTNAGNNTLKSFTYEAYIDHYVDGNLENRDTITKEWTGELEAGASMEAGFGSFSSASPGNYDVDLIVTSGDVEEYGSTSFEVDVPRALPYEPYVEFHEDPASGDNWYHNGFSYDWNNDELYKALASGDTGIVRTPVFETIRNKDYLVYHYRIQGNFDNYDKVKVMASADCGETYTTLETIVNSDNVQIDPSETKHEMIDLAQAGLEGEKIHVKFEAVNIGGDNFTFYLGGFGIASRDVSIADISTENRNDRYVTLGETNDSLFVDIVNNSVLPVESVPVVVTKNDTVTENYTLNETLEPGAAYDDFFIGTLNTTISGLHNVSASVAVPDDSNPENDSLAFSITTQTPYAVPYLRSEYNDENFWNIDWDNNMNVNSYEVYSNWLSKGEMAYAKSPVITDISETTHLVFRYSAYNSSYDHIISNEVINVKIDTNGTGNYEQISHIDVNTNDTADSNIMEWIDLSDYAGTDIRVMFEVKKGASEGMFKANFRDIKVVDYTSVQLAQDTVDLVPGDAIEMNAGTDHDDYDWYRAKTGDDQIGNGQFYTITRPDTYYVEAEKYDIVSRDTLVAVESLPAPGYITSSDSMACNNSTTSHSVPILDNVERYVWTLDPTNAGAIVSQNYLNEAVEIDWNSSYTGEATISVKAMYQYPEQEQNSMLKSASQVNNETRYSDAVTRTINVDKCIVGIDDVKGESMLSIYPNPVRNTLHFELDVDRMNDFRYEVVNSFGSVVKFDRIEDGNVQDVNISGLADGIYMLKVYSEDEVFIQRFVKE